MSFSCGISTNNSKISVVNYRQARNLGLSSALSAATVFGKGGEGIGTPIAKGWPIPGNPTSHLQIIKKRKKQKRKRGKKEKKVKRKEKRKEKRKLKKK